MYRKKFLCIELSVFFGSPNFVFQALLEFLPFDENSFCWKHKKVCGFYLGDFWCFSATLDTSFRLHVFKNVFSIQLIENCKYEAHGSSMGRRRASTFEECSPKLLSIGRVIFVTVTPTPPPFLQTLLFRSSSPPCLLQAFEKWEISFLNHK